ncbi:hypothetical protein Pmani_003157 [Petrolisthes manimaculis]|uniref:Uncharacterized protein n=1 Tax=Petrolisthes manimaculis TaxID=1843537 RepID=A0AAE1QH36_9EUCA|nr:hypothetical protein Pmani_003157 [Petrolisthes manimaculis]
MPLPWRSCVSGTVRVGQIPFLTLMTKKFPQLGETLRTREVKETQRGDELPTSPKKKKNASKPVVLPPPQEEVLIEKSQNREKVVQLTQSMLADIIV